MNSHVASTYEAPALSIGSLDFDYLVMKAFRMRIPKEGSAVSR